MKSLRQMVLSRLIFGNENFHRDYALIRRAGIKKIKSNQENRVEQVKPIWLRWRGVI